MNIYLGQPNVWKERKKKKQKKKKQAVISTRSLQQHLRPPYFRSQTRFARKLCLQRDKSSLFPVCTRQPFTH